MDYCQEPFDIMVTFKERIAFTFCEECQGLLASPEGRQILGIAEQLTANPFRQRGPKLFLSYVREDNDHVERLLADLRRRGFDAWKDNHELLAGEDWAKKIEETLSSYDFAVMCLSEVAVKSDGYFKQELRRALERAASTPGYALPVAFEVCEFSEVSAKYHVESLFPDWDRGVTQLTKAITVWWTRRIA